MTPTVRLLGFALVDEIHNAGLDPRAAAARVILDAHTAVQNGAPGAIEWVQSEWLDAWCFCLGEGVRADAIRREILGRYLAEAGAPATDDLLRDAERLIALWRRYGERVAPVAVQLGVDRSTAAKWLRRAGADIARRGRPRLSEAA